MLRKVVDNTQTLKKPGAHVGLNWHGLKLKALDASHAASPYVRRPIAFVLGVVSYLVFLALLWLRPLVRALARLVGGLMLLALAIGFFVVSPRHEHVLWVIGGASFASFLFGWLYDWLLLRISPEPIGFLD